MSNSNNISPESRRLCADAALRCHGTAYIFENRAKTLRYSVTILSFLGIAVPALVGAIITTYSINSTNLKYILWVAGLISTVQLLLSIWSLVSGWNSNLAYYLESKTDNYRLSDLYSKLGNTTRLSLTEFDVELRILDKEAQLRTSSDQRYDISEKEKRSGMRHALRRFERQCAGCDQIPTTMEATNCGICGNPGRCIWKCKTQSN